MLCSQVQHLGHADGIPDSHVLYGHVVSKLELVGTIVYLVRKERFGISLVLSSKLNGPPPHALALDQPSTRRIFTPPPLSSNTLLPASQIWG